MTAPTPPTTELKDKFGVEKQQIFTFPLWLVFSLDFPGGSYGKAFAYNVGDQGSIPASGRSPGEGNGNPLQYSYLENPMDAVTS